MIRLLAKLSEKRIWRVLVAYRGVVFIGLLGVSLAACQEKSADLPPELAADVVLINGGIYTVDTQHSWAEAAAIRDDKIIAVGDNAAIKALVGADTEVIDLIGRMAMPGIIDSHVHPLEGGYENVFCNLWDADSVDLVLETLRDCDAASDPDDSWFQALGLDLGLFGLDGADNSILEGIAEGKFIFVDFSDGHSALVNDKVLDLVGFGADAADPENGLVERRENSRVPNGTLREAARDIVDGVRPERDMATSLFAMRGAIRSMNSFGITSVYDVWVGKLEMSIYKTLDDAGELSVYVLGAIIDEGAFQKASGDELDQLVDKRHEFESDRIRFGAAKIMVDGVVEGETAALIEPYETTGTLGQLYHSPQQLRDRVARYYNQGMQLHFHTMGDAAVRAALDALESVRESGDPKLKKTRHALSHLGLVHPGDYARFAQQNAAAAFTLVWAYTDDWAIGLEVPALGQERVDNLYPIRSIIAAGGRAVGSSDWNYGELNPLLSIETGVTRQDPFGPPEFKTATHETVDLATMIDAYTINGAWLMQREDETGSIETGKLADFVIYDRNLFELDSTALSETNVDATIFNGRVVYRRGDLP